MYIYNLQGEKDHIVLVNYSSQYNNTRFNLESILYTKMLHKMHVVVGDVRVIMYQSVGKKNCQTVYNLVSESEDSNAEVDDAA